MNRFESLIEKIVAALCPDGIKIESYKSIDSTNKKAKAYAAEATSAEPVLFIAERQTAGRGRLGRQFHSECMGSIYMTLLYFTRDELCDAVTVTTATAVSVARAIERATGREVGIKWVNDIYNEQGKVAGILVETASSMHGHAIAVGIGINAGDCEFPPELSGIAATVGELDDEARAMMVCDICRGVLACAKNHKDRSYMEYYRRAFILQDKLVDVFVDDKHELRGRVAGVSDDGALLIKPREDGEIVSLASGNITVRIVE